MGLFYKKNSPFDSGSKYPEIVSEWLMEQNKNIWNSIYVAATKPIKINGVAVPVTILDVETLISISVKSWQLQLAMITFTYQLHLDDSRYMSCDSTGKITVDALWERIQKHANHITKKHTKINTADFDHLVYSGCILEFDSIRNDTANFYTMFFRDVTELHPRDISKNDIYRYALGVIGLMQIDNSKREILSRSFTIACAYYLAFLRALNNNNREPKPDPLSGTLDANAYCGIRFWEIWHNHFILFQKNTPSDKLV